MLKSHAAGWTSESPTPAQLKEFFAQISPGRDGKPGKITSERLQAFLRGEPKTTIMQSPVTESEWEGDRTLAAIERLCQEEFPEHVIEVLDVIRPFCAKDLSFELQPPTFSCETPVKRIIGDERFRPRFVDLGHPILSESYHKDGLDVFKTQVAEFFSKPLETLGHLNASLPSFSCGLLRVECRVGNRSSRGLDTFPSVRELIARQTDTTMVVYYDLVGYDIIWSLGHFCNAVLEMAISFAAVGDRVRSQKLVALLELTRNGNWPIFYHKETQVVQVLCRPNGRHGYGNWAD